jgi:hypothetical protein
MVGLPTLVQNPPTANGNGNPTGLDSRLFLFGLPVTEKKEERNCNPWGLNSQILQPYLTIALTIELWNLNDYIEEF